MEYTPPEFGTALPNLCPDMAERPACIDALSSAVSFLQNRAWRPIEPPNTPGEIARCIAENTAAIMALGKTPDSDS
jgi:hypothetical protein